MVHKTSLGVKVFYCPHWLSDKILDEHGHVRIDGLELAFRHHISQEDLFNLYLQNKQLMTLTDGSNINLFDAFYPYHDDDIYLQDAAESFDKYEEKMKAQLDLKKDISEIIVDENPFIFDIRQLGLVDHVHYLPEEKVLLLIAKDGSRQLAETPIAMYESTRALIRTILEKMMPYHPYDELAKTGMFRFFALQENNFEALFMAILARNK